MGILIFGGTSEGRLLSDRLTEKNIAHTLSVATEYGEQIIKGDSPARKVIAGRMDEKAIEELIMKDGSDLLIDATHPYATEITGNIIKAVKAVNDRADSVKVRAIRLKRKDDGEFNSLSGSYEKSYIHEDMSKAAEMLKKTSGNILLTTGSRDLGKFAGAFGKDDLSRVYVRVIPGFESIKKCEEAGIEASHIIAMQGPFIRELNEALIRQYDIKHLVTKDSGKTGGAESKAEAAMNCKIALHVIKRPAENTDIKAVGLEEAIDIINEHAGEAGSVRNPDGKMGRLRISLAGMGMGDIGNITRETFREIECADVIFGAERLINICRENKLNPGAEYAAFYKPDEAVSYIRDLLLKKGAADRDLSVVMLFSGDSGFNSGCRKVSEALEHEFMDRTKTEIRVYPGISSVAYLSAKLKRPYENAYICSTHGKGEESIYRAAAHVRISSDVFVLTGGIEDVAMLAKILNDSGLGGCIIDTAFDMSSKNELIITDTAENYANGRVLKNRDLKGSLFTCHIFNPEPLQRGVAAGLSADQFIRGDVPMTKEEVRAVAIDKLRLTPYSRVLDVGCGTGSVTVEIARLIPEGMVFSYDVNEKAVNLTRDNVLRHKLPNVIVKQGTLPDVMDPDGDFPEDLTHVFIGGNNGRLTDILDRLKTLSESREGETRIRIVLNVITKKTGEALRSWTEQNSVSDYDVVKIGVCRGDEMIPGNDVYIYSFEV